ncbi:hypothetical protein GGX14DRAFT_401374 [Mycena pura]|uniref:Uncharacterized protein n=1 Tax=Mycena pura TaxID=153505 RepID=A0AAD6V098_9AGAR|nr:hypothetical protein GGX14DRAFT_401374 [Mycena pura]
MLGISGSSQAWKFASLDQNSMAELAQYNASDGQRNGYRIRIFGPDGPKAEFKRILIWGVRQKGSAPKRLGHRNGSSPAMFFACLSFHECTGAGAIRGADPDNCPTADRLYSPSNRSNVSPRLPITNVTINIAAKSSTASVPIIRMRDTTSGGTSECTMAPCQNRQLIEVIANVAEHLHYRATAFSPLSSLPNPSSSSRTMATLNIMLKTQQENQEILHGAMVHSEVPPLAVSRIRMTGTDAAAENLAAMLMKDVTFVMGGRGTDT